VIFILSFLAISCSLCVYAEDNYAMARKKMVTEQIVDRGVTDSAVIDAMQSVPRHEFIPWINRYLAYSDRPVPIGYNQTISQPYIVALMTEFLQLKGNEKVLEIGTGSGYQAAILSLLCKEVYTIEILEPLAKSSKQRLKRLGYDNVEVKHGDGYLGWPDEAPFDAIIVTAAPPEIPQKLVEQLTEGGRMVIPVGESYQQLQLIEKIKGKIKIKNIIPVRFVPMVESKEYR
jgi:protein-L-isoaspartate(D-aspartate) O-methyltransferase